MVIRRRTASELPLAPCKCTVSCIQIHTDSFLYLFSVSVMTERYDVNDPTTLDIGVITEIRGLAANATKAKKSRTAEKDVSCMLFI